MIAISSKSIGIYSVFVELDHNKLIIYLVESESCLGEP